MASNILSRFLPPGTGEPSIYETLRQQEDSDSLDVEERAGMGAGQDAEPGFQDDDFQDPIYQRPETGGDASVVRPSNRTSSKSRMKQGRRQREAPSGREASELEEQDDEVPHSLLIEGREEALPKIQGRRQIGQSPSSAGPSNAGVQAKWQAAQEQQRLHLDIVPPLIRPANIGRNLRGGSSLDPRERALWMWTNVTNLDIFLKDVYDYYMGNGIWCITLSRLLDLLTLAFVVAFSTFLLTCINFRMIPQSKSMDQILIPKCTRKWSFSTNLLLWLFALYWIYKLFESLYDLRRLRRLQGFFSCLLDVPDGDIQTVAWQEIVKKLMDLRDLNATTAAEVKQSHQRFIGSQSKQRMDAHDIANRLMRRDNYLIALINKDILNLSLPIPFLRRRQLFSKTLEWNLSLCILDHVFDERGQVRPLFLKDTYRRALSESLRRRFLFAGFMNALCAPFIVIFFVLFYFFRYFTEFQRNPSQIGSRQYNPLAEWKFREFNELWHFFERRLNMSYPFASRYVDQFPKDKTVQISRFVAFVTGALASVLAVASVVDPELFLAFEITPERTVLFYLGVFGSIWAVARGAVPSENMVFDPEFALKDVISYTRYMPSHWSGRLHTNEVRGEFSELYKMKVLIFLEELLSILLTPFVLWFSLPNCSDKIIDFFREFTLHVDGLGYVCSFAVFDFKKGGSRSSRPNAAGEPKLRDEYYSTKDGKMLASYYGFIDNYVTSQRPGAPFLHPEARQSFHAPPMFPGMMASNWLAEAQGAGKGSKSERHPRAPERSMMSGPIAGNRSVYRRTPRFGPTAEQASPVASVLLDPQHQPSKISTRAQRKGHLASRLRGSRSPLQEHPDAQAEAAEISFHNAESADRFNDQEDQLGESWKTTRAGDRDEDREENSNVTDNDGIPGVLGLVYQFSKAQNEGRGAGVNL